MYAIVDIAGHQFKVEKDQKLFVHRLEGEEGNKVSFDKVLLIDTDTQGHCSRLLGVDPDRGLAELIDGTASPEKAVITAHDGLYLLAGGRNLEGISRLISREGIAIL